MENQEIIDNIDMQKNIVLFGLSGSGKDTIANFLEYELNYFKIRIAGTIKQIIQENRNMSEDELEEAKRIHSNIRQEHHDVGNYLGLGTINRVKLIISGKVNEFKYKQSYQSVVVHDGRGLDREIKLFLENPDWICIFLSRNNYDKEFRNTQHWTEEGSIENALKFIKENNFYSKSIIIMNDKKETELTEEYLTIAEDCLGYYNISKESTANNLIAVIHDCIKNELI